ncbi:hypothetical protein [Methanocella sp. MCL-LM]|uniref:hypothetical protein n=1 Tax=Methanocella sp. MCL-LM TaxID=3412035 RepID=UPI003C73A72D
MTLPVLPFAPTPNDEGNVEEVAEQLNIDPALVEKYNRMTFWYNVIKSAGKTAIAVVIGGLVVLYEVTGINSLSTILVAGIAIGVLDVAIGYVLNRILDEIIYRVN